MLYFKKLSIFEPVPKWGENPLVMFHISSVVCIAYGFSRIQSEVLLYECS